MNTNSLRQDDLFWLLPGEAAPEDGLLFWAAGRCCLQDYPFELKLRKHSRQVKGYPVLITIMDHKTGDFVGFLRLSNGSESFTGNVPLFRTLDSLSPHALVEGIHRMLASEKNYIRGLFGLPPELKNPIHHMYFVF